MSELANIKRRNIHIYNDLEVKDEQIHWNHITDDENIVDDDCEDFDCCDDEDTEECTCDECENIDYEVGLIIDTTNKILEHENCPNCIFDLVKLLAYKMKAIGWNNCVEYHGIQYCEDEENSVKH